MKNIGNKTLLFYYFQLDKNRDYNVTALNTSQSPIIKDVLMALPLDLTQGLYHFRFKSQLADGDDKVIAWIDINNLGAKVPQINGSIYLKILKLKDYTHNKLFHLDKLKKAQIVKLGSDHQHVHSTPKPVIISNPNPTNQTPARVTKLEPAKPINSNPSIKTPTNTVTTSKDNFIQFQVAKPKFVTTTTQQNLQTFVNQAKHEEEHRQNQKLAQAELEEQIRKWGYTDGKKINNTTTLLATLHQIWTEWEPISLTDMLKPQQVSAVFKKAAIKLHPDKNRHRHFKQKYLSKRIFELLNESRRN